MHIFWVLLHIWEQPFDMLRCQECQHESHVQIVANAQHFSYTRQVNIGLRVLTRPMPAKLPELYRTLGTDYAERVLPSIIQVNAAQTTSMLAVLLVPLVAAYPADVLAV